MNDIAVLIALDGQWKRLEQEFDNQESAYRFACAEVGVPWVVIDGPNAIVMGDARGAFRVFHSHVKG